MSFDETILLKIKREFTTNEAVQQLLKLLSERETEIGVLKSELSEAIDKAEKLRTESKMTKKEWLKDEVIAQIEHLRKTEQKKLVLYKKSLEDWRYKYFNLLAKNAE